MALEAFASYLWAAGTTTSSLVVNGDSELRGDLKVADASTGSAPTNGLILYYSFSTNTTPVADDSGNSHTGTVSGATWVTNGITGGAYSFDGSNDYLQAVGYKGVSGGNPRTIAFWFNTIQTNNNIPMFFYGTWGVVAGDGVWMGINYASAGGATLQFDGGQTIKQTISASDGAWHQEVCIYDGTVASLYVDGSLIGILDNPIVNSGITYDVFLGKYGAGSYYFNGSIDEVRIYDRALSTNEVEGLYLYDAHLIAGTARFETGVSFVKPLGDILMGVYTNGP